MLQIFETAIHTGGVKQDERRGFFRIPQVFRFEGNTHYVPEGPKFKADYRSAKSSYPTRFHSPGACRLAWIGDEVLLA